MRIGMVGINHKLADVPFREAVAKAIQKQFRYDFPVVIISTCNRIEVYFSVEDLAKGQTVIIDWLRHQINYEFDQKLYSFFGKHCFLHLARVTAGLDSAIIAETAIQGQVKECYEEFKKIFLLPKELHYLFQKSLKIGKEVRSLLIKEETLPNLEHALFSIGKKHFSEVSPKILLVGASAINERIGALLQKKQMKNLTICNRSDEKAIHFSEKLNISFLPWEKRVRWPLFDWVICGTKSPHYLLFAKDIMGKIEVNCKVLADLSVPRNVDPQISFLEKMSLYNIDQINEMLAVRRSRLSSSLKLAETLIFSKVGQHLHSFQFNGDKQKIYSIADCA